MCGFGAKLVLLTALLSAQAAHAAAPSTSYVLLFDKDCPRCRLCVPYSESKRQTGHATLTLLERRGADFVINKVWAATYGMAEGPKACLYDNRTPEGLYYTHYVNRNHDQTYGYVAILTDYPNEEDRHDLAVGSTEVAADKCLCRERGTLRNRQWGMCHRACVDTGVGIAIHGGHAGATRGCIRVLDPGLETSERRLIHRQAIAELAALVEVQPDMRVPVISVIESAPGCHSDIGEAVSRGCADALRAVLDTPQRPSREVVRRLLAQARGLPKLHRGTTPVIAAALPVMTPSEPPAPVLRKIDIDSVWATSEGTVCGAKEDGPCPASALQVSTGQRAWCEGVTGPGEGQWLRFTFSGTQPISRVEIMNGYSEKGGGSPSWFRRGYVTAVELVVNGHRTTCSHPQEDPTQLDCDLDGTPGSSLLLRIKSAVAGELTDDICISGVTILTSAAPSWPR